MPYLERLGRRGGIEIWQVDGAWIRQRRDVDFTNFGHHGSFDFVPPDEIWLDVEADPDEKHLFLRHALAEWREVKKGADYDEARKRAVKSERRLRARSRDAARVLGPERLPHAEKVHVRLWKQLENGLCIWLVDGRLVRSNFHVEFTFGGHEHVYEFVPPNEIWIDDDVRPIERGFVLLHELVERRLMAQGELYLKAHEAANVLERRARRTPAMLHELLAAEGWE